MKGHSGSTNWFYRSSFCANDVAVLAGTSVGTTTLWSTQTGQVLHTLTLPTNNTTFTNNNNNFTTTTTTAATSPLPSSRTLNSNSNSPPKFSSQFPPQTNFSDFLSNNNNNINNINNINLNINNIITSTKDSNYLNKTIEQYKKSEIVRCYYDKSSGLVGSLTGNSYILWK